MIVDYIEFFLYFAAFVLGVMLIVQMIALYAKYKNIYLGLFSLAFIATSLLALCYLINDLISLGIISNFYLLTAYGEAVSLAVIMWSITMCVLRIIFDDVNAIVKGAIHVTILVTLVIKLLWVPRMYKAVDLDSLYYYFFLAVLMIDCILFLRKYKKINRQAFRKLAIAFTCILLFFLIFLILQEIVPGFNLDIFPIFYLFWTVQLIAFSWKHFFIDGIDKVFNIKEGFVEKYSITKREQEIILLIQEGYTNNAISKQLFLSEKTVANHIYNIYKKLGITSRFELICLFKN